MFYTLFSRVRIELSNAGRYGKIKDTIKGR
jgi:hypothetical protein